MAAKPIERHILKQVKEKGGWEAVIDRIGSGDTVLTISQDYKRPDGTPVSRSFLARLLHQDRERSAKVMEARREAASMYVEDALRVVDQAPLDKDAIQKARVQSDVRLRVAGMLDRQQYGQQQAQVNVQVNVESMHLDSLRHRQIPAERTVPAVPVPTASVRQIARSDRPARAERADSQTGSQEEPTVEPTVLPEQSP
jgi:cell division septum initiation protein DivIVA